MADICGDNRFEIIERAKKDILATTNIESRKEEMEVLDDFLFRCWQMGWLQRYESLPDRFIEIRIHLRSNDPLEMIRNDIETELSSCWHVIDTIAVKEVNQ